jgi:dienelactone hydrolase
MTGKETWRATALCLSLLAVVAAGCSPAPPRPDVRGQEVTYAAGETTLKGYLAYDAAKEGKRPGILVVHEWWGHNEYARKRARMLAELGYTALAVDMYGDGKQAGHPEDAGKFAASVFQNMEGAKARFLAAKDLLTAQPSVDPEKIAAIGYCFGGGIVLNMARAGVDLDAVVSFHGSLAAAVPVLPGGVKARLLVCNGEDDSFLTPEQIEAFKREMTDAGVSFLFRSYPGAKHSFTNPEADRYGRDFNIPLAYNAQADSASWADMKSFLASTFAP